MTWHITPIIGTFFYIYISGALKKLHPIQSISKYVHYYSITHNVLLAAFSLYTFVSLARVMIKQGIIPGHNFYMSQPYVKNLIFWFYMSKYYEYFDTFLLYIKRREPIFLQKYHHIGAAVCWHLCYQYDVDMGVFATILNSFVHSIMYSYYLMTLLKWNIRGIRMYITMAQMAQLVFGGMSGLYYYYSVESQWNYSIIVFFNMYIMGLVYLFGEFMMANYSTAIKKVKM